MTTQAPPGSVEKVRLTTLGAGGETDMLENVGSHRILGLVADVMGTPIVGVALTSGEWIGLGTQAFPDVGSVEKSDAVRALMLWSDGLDAVVLDTAHDARLAATAAVPGSWNIRFYMAVPLKDQGGKTLGRLCVMDTAPRQTASPADLDRLRSFGCLVVDALQRRIADRRQSENRRLLGLAETMSGVGHWRFDVRSGEVVWSDEVYRIHGLEPARFDPMLDDVLSFYHPDDRPVLESHIAHSLTTGDGYEVRLRVQRADGCLREVAAKATCEIGADGKVTALFGVFQDITDQVNSLAEVQQSKAHYQALTETMSDVIARVPLDGSPPYVSPRIFDLLGYEPHEVLGGPPYGLIAEPDRGSVVAAYQAMARGQEEASVRHRAIHRDGRTIWAETRLRLVRDTDGAPNCVIAVIRDISVQKALEDELTQARGCRSCSFGEV